ncbi:hypothetical protein BP5796_03454 [Coleophoma crateriformis]|uniref:Transmembrane protein n=1 Tax=Coleophoma crateriformis TaxID=565419 RepID=A0A3D8SN79_9HELO|nr:hypothetical protein BP5796_03454 [Coleophoma crateriformis]
MPRGRHRAQLGDSWVVEGSEDEVNYEPGEEDLPTRTTRRHTRASNRSPEPEFVMPPLDPDTLEASWADNSSRSTRFRKRVNGDGIKVRRGPRQDRTPEKSPRLEAATPRSSVSSAGHTSSSPNATSDTNTSQDFFDAAIRHTGVMLSYALEVLGGALRILKTPVSILLAVYLLLGAGTLLQTLVTKSLYASLSPICRLPGTALLSLPFCPPPGTNAGENRPGSAEFDQLMTVQAKFDEVLEKSADGVSLPMDMKRGEASIRDLRQLVRYSQLQAKNELVLEFDGFIETARIASYDLQKFNSHVGRSVDSVIATTKWTTRVLDHIQLQDSGRGAISAFVNDKLLAPFQPTKFTERTVLDQYIKHTQIIEEEINTLIGEAQALLHVLNNLENRLEVIQGITTRDNVDVSAKREEVLAQLWTMVGGNRGKLSKMDRQIGLLHQVNVYQKQAFAHVAATLTRLQKMGADLENLRERVGAPELLQDRNIPLSVHIHQIELCVERLEQGRRNARKLEDAHIKENLERGKVDDSNLIGS